MLLLLNFGGKPMFRYRQYPGTCRVKKPDENGGRKATSIPRSEVISSLRKKSMADKVVCLPASLADIEAVSAYHAPLNLTAANALLDKLDQRISALVGLPKMGKAVVDLESQIAAQAAHRLRRTR